MIASTNPPVEPQARALSPPGRTAATSSPRPPSRFGVARDSSQPLRVLVAFAAVALAWLARVILTPLVGNEAPFLPYIVAAIGTAWYGGFYPGMIVTILAIIVGTFLPPYTLMFVGPQKVVWYVLFAAVGFSISLVCESLHAARRRAELSVSSQREAERRFQLVIEGIQDHSIVMLDPAGKVLLWSPGASNLFGYEAKEALGQAHTRFFTPEDIAAGMPVQELNEAIANGRAAHDGWRVRRDGSRFWGVGSITAIHHDGELRGFVKITRDVTERKKQDEAIAESRKNLLSLVNSAMDGIISVDMDQRVDLFNPAAEHMFGIRAEDILGQRVERLMPERFRPTHEAHVRRFGDTGVTSRQMGDLGAISGLRANGVEFPIEASISQMTIEGRKQFTVIMRDVSQRKKSEAELQKAFAELKRSNGELEQFAYIASHDLQEPLRAVSGCVQVLQRRYKEQLDSYAEELIGHAVAGAVRMQTLINDLLSYSRVATRGKEFLPTDCNKVLEHVLANLDVAIKESHAAITIENLPVVRGDSTQLTQLFQNLISNAIKFRGAGPPDIAVRAQRDAAGWVFSVRDKGIGIAAEYFERIFVIFQRLHTRNEYAGTGIGLSVCKKIVERHNGRIWVESEPGKGSTFFFTLPDMGENV